MRRVPRLRGRCCGTRSGDRARAGHPPRLRSDGQRTAANTLHARAVAGTGGGGDRLVSVAPDMGGEPISSAGPAPQAPQAPRSAGCPELWSTCAASGSAVNSSARCSTATAAGATVRHQPCPGWRPRPYPGAACRSCTSCPAAPGGPMPPGPGSAAGACAARPSGSPCPRRWPMPGWWMSPGCARTRSRPTSRRPGPRRLSAEGRPGA